MEKCKLPIHVYFLINETDLKNVRATPWNGLYCSSKAAVHSISESLYMELKPLGISVFHVAPGATKSNIAANGTSRFSLSPDSLYAAYLPDIIRRINASQGPASMPTKVFAKKVVSKALKTSPPRYMMLGGHSGMFALLKWLPRQLTLWMLWRMWSKKA